MQKVDSFSTEFVGFMVKWSNSEIVENIGAWIVLISSEAYKSPFQRLA